MFFLFVLLYRYQSGYFQLRRRLRVRPPVTPPQEQPPREEAPPQDGETEPNDNQVSLLGCTVKLFKIQNKNSHVLKPHCPTCSYLLPLYRKQCLISDHWSLMILFFLR